MWTTDCEGPVFSCRQKIKIQVSQQLSTEHEGAYISSSTPVTVCIEVVYIILW